MPYGSAATRTRRDVGLRGSPRSAVGGGRTGRNGASWSTLSPSPPQLTLPGSSAAVCKGLPVLGRRPSGRTHRVGAAAAGSSRSAAPGGPRGGRTPGRRGAR
eukprot:12150508-Alexandrium_andersonii.AAC.1